MNIDAVSVEGGQASTDPGLQGSLTHAIESA
jgi:hypothetical protein